MTILELKYKESSSKAIFFYIKYLTFWGIEKNDEIMMKISTCDKLFYFETCVYFSNTGNDVYHKTIADLMINEYEKSNDYLKYLNNKKS